MKTTVKSLMGTALLALLAGCASDDHPGHVQAHDHVHQYPIYDHSNPQHRMRANSANPAFSPAPGAPGGSAGPGTAASGNAGASAGANVGVGSSSVGGNVGGNANIGVKTP